MALLDDRLSKPAAGREFPDSFPSILQQVQSLAFSVHDYHERLPIMMENCVAECDRGYQLCSSMRMRYLAVFSLPQDIPRGIAGKALGIALQRYAGIDRGPHLSCTTSNSSYIAPSSPRSAGCRSPVTSCRA